MIDEDLLRSRAVEVATSLVGFSISDDPFLEWSRLLNVVPPAQSRGLAAFIVEGVWKALGVHHERLMAPVDEDLSIFRLTEVAMDCGAWRCRPRDYVPLPGDVAVLGDGSLAGPHVYFVVGVDVRLGAPLSIRSVEGSSAGVEAKIRSWEGSKDSVTQRSILGWIDIASLPQRSLIDG